MASTQSTKQKQKTKRKEYSIEQVKTLGQQLLSSRAHINNIPKLLTFVSPSSSPEYVLECILSLQSFFIPVLSDLPPSSSKSLLSGGVVGKSSVDPELEYRSTVRLWFDEFVNSLIAIAVSSKSSETLKVSFFFSCS